MLLNEQLKTANTTIGDLKKIILIMKHYKLKVGEYEEQKVKGYEKQIQDMQFNYALEGALKGANVRNTKAVKALLNLENVKLDGETLIGINEQIEKLKRVMAICFVEEQNQPQFTGIKAYRWK